MTTRDSHLYDAVRTPSATMSRGWPDSPPNCWRVARQACQPAKQPQPRWDTIIVQVAVGDTDAVPVGGMESMSRASGDCRKPFKSLPARGVDLDIVN